MGEVHEASAAEVETLALTEAPEQQKRPPQEVPGNVRLRTLVVLSFWSVVIFLGLPVWWWTTSIYRARLPLDEMLQWADGKACRPTFPLHIAIEASSLQRQEALRLLDLTQHTLDDSNEFPSHHLRLRLAESIGDLRRVNASVNFDGYSGTSRNEDDEGSTSTGQQDEALVVRLLPVDALEAPSAALIDHSSTLQLLYNPNQVPSVSSSSSTLASYIARELQSLFEEEQTILSYVLSRAAPSLHMTTQSAHESRDVRSPKGLHQRPETADLLASRALRSLKYAPTYHITISMFSSSATPSTWAIQEAVTRYLTPLLTPMSRLSNFTVDTQVQIHAELASTVQQPMYDESVSSWTLREEDLSGFINAAEWPLSPSIGAGPTINFVLHVPDPGNTPLVVRGSRANSWLVPQWGGVYILNTALPPNTTRPVESLAVEDLRPALLTFSHQLLALLGVPQTPLSLPLQLRTLTRVQAASLLLSASATMGSLARLTKALPTIAIPRTVSTAVDLTLINLHNTCEALKDGRFSDALAYARTAETEAEKGFFEKSMVGQVYFPDEHKVAVYLPLLGPIGVPLVMSAIKEIKRLVNAWKSHRRLT